MNKIFPFGEAGVKNKAKINYGLSFLKVLLAFDVINGHCFNAKSTSNKIIHFLLKSNRLHVPSFIIMSFYFTHNVIIYLDISKIKKRFERLLIPYLGWPFIYFILSNSIHYFYKQFLPCPFKNLIYQIILGHARNIPLYFWFLFDLILTNIIFLFIIITTRKDYKFLLILLMCFSYFLQYSKLNLYLHFYINEQSIGRENEFIPYAVTGFILSEFNIIKNLHFTKVKTFIISLIIRIIIIWNEYVFQI